MIGSNCDCPTAVEQRLKILLANRRSEMVGGYKKYLQKGGHYSIKKLIKLMMISMAYLCNFMGLLQMKEIPSYFELIQADVALYTSKYCAMNEMIPQS